MKKLFIVLILIFSLNVYGQDYTSDEALIGRLYKIIVELNMKISALTKENTELKEQLKAKP